MATRPLPTRKPDQADKKTDQVRTPGISVKKPLLQMISSVSKGPALQQQLHGLMKKRWLRVVGIVIAVFLALLIALPFFLNVNSFRPQIETEATSALGRQVKFGDMNLSILSGSVGIENISVADDPAFSESPFLTAKSLKVGVELLPLLLSKQLNVTRIVLSDPQITLLKGANGVWNFSTLGATAEKKALELEKSESSASQGFSVGKLEIKGGKLIVGQAKSAKKNQVYNKVNLEVRNFSYTSQFPFKLSANLPGGGDADFSGKAGPINSEDSSRTPVEGTLKVNKMDLATSGFIDAASGLGGVANVEGTLYSNGREANVIGRITCDKLILSPKGSPAPKPVGIDYAADANLEKQTGTITRGDIAIGRAIAHVTGGFQVHGPTQVVNLRLNAPEMPVDELQAMLPALGVAIPSGSKLQGGTLSAELGIAGPVDKLVITGPVRLANTKLMGFDLGSKLGALAAFTGKAPAGPDTNIQNASLNAHVAPEGTRANAINLILPAFAVITGAGTISPAGALNFKMIANLQGGMVGGLTKVAALGGSKDTGIPFSITGTTSNPSFVPDVAGVAGSVAEGAIGNVASATTGATKGVTGAAGALGGMLGKKKEK